MYLALSGWLSIVLVVALAAWQEDSEQSDDGGSGPLFPRKMGPIHPQIVYCDLFDRICDVSYLQYIRCI